MIVLSESWKQFYIKNCHLNPERVVVLHNPVVIPPEIPERLSQKKLRFVFLGKIDQRKGIYDLLKAFSLLSIHQQEKVQLILAGTGEEDQAKQLAESLGIAQHIQCPGWINEQQRNNLLAQADGFLLPSYQEGLPMALLEAMSWQLPCITTPVGGIPEVITDQETGLLVNPGDVKQLMIAMQVLIKDESMRLSLGKAAQERIKPYDINKYCVTLSELYQISLTEPKKKLQESQLVLKDH